MKNLFTFLLFLVCIKSHSQTIADPAIDQVLFTDLAGSNIPDTLPLGYIAVLNVPIKNQSAVNILPAGSCKIKIGLGSKIILDPAFALNLVNTSQYFSWTQELNSGQIQLTGDLIADLPANFSEVAKFNVQGNVLDYSTVSTNFLITNHNSQVVLSDNDPANNSSFRPYKIIPPVPVPVNFTSLFAAIKDCNIEVSFTTENEINVNNFQIETSKDGIHFTKAGAVVAARLGNYKFQFPVTAAVSSPNLYIRIKSIDNDGSFRYSAVKMLNTQCKGKISMGIYPNPVGATAAFATIKVSGGLLTGKYKAALYDIAGQLISIKSFSFAGNAQFEYPLGKVPSGKYLIKIINETDGQAVVLSLQKL